MEQPFVLNLDNDTVRFTPDGKVSVVDAIKAISNSGHPRTIWESLKENHPELLDHCEEYSFKDNVTVPVVDSSGWGKIWLLLTNYFFDVNG